MKNALTVTLILSFIVTFFILEDPKPRISKQTPNVDVSPGIGTKTDRFARFNYMRQQLVDPATGTIPPFMRQRELMFAQAMNASAKSAGTFDMVSRGPYNVGGRTRAMAIDIDDENILIAGSVSGGVWKSIDAGASWYRVSSSLENLAVTTIVQDPRPGHHDEWYYGTGELFGASQSAPGAFFLGNGIYKSIDNGETWTSIAATAPNSPQSFNTPWEGIWRIAIDPSDTTRTELYAATYTTIYRSINGGSSWSTVLAPPNFNQISYFTDVSVTSDGVVYAGMSKENIVINGGLSPVGGIWRSTDGANFTNILPANFPPTYNRIVMGINPSDEDEIYFLVSNVDSTFGKECNTIMQNTSWNALWRYNYISGNGTGAGGMWTDLSQNLYVGPDDYDDFNPQSGYNLCVAVSPADPNVVIVGGTNLYRSTNGFNSPDSVDIIGGFEIGMQWPIFEDYPGHHSDQHGVAFLPSNPNVMYSFNDGGIGRTDNVMDTSVTWTSLENGYLTSQFYHVAIDMNDTNDVIVGGLQDNGNFYTNTKVNTTPWIRPHNGDGGPAYFAKNNDFLMLSVQLGVLLKVQIDSAGNELAYERIDPDVPRGDFQFIHPYALDPNDDDYLYLPVGKKLWVKNDVTSVALNNGYAPTLSGWTAQNDSLPSGSLIFTAIATTNEVQKKVYLGTSSEKIYRVDDASNPNSPLVDITDTQFPNAYLRWIAVD
ncbi:MAG: hypothetical protein HKN22_05860, partial [Bacteroidia bacterium]|nr:hypothetical protein [Bacteroidia bacterium]